VKLQTTQLQRHPATPTKIKDRQRTAIPENGDTTLKSEAPGPARMSIVKIKKKKGNPKYRASKMYNESSDDRRQQAARGGLKWTKVKKK
jgi:hypothetical protein